MPVATLALSLSPFLPRAARDSAFFGQGGREKNASCDPTRGLEPTPLARPVAVGPRARMLCALWLFRPRDLRPLTTEGALRSDVGQRDREAEMMRRESLRTSPQVYVCLFAFGV